jgi:NAD-dependent deacetylase
MRKKICVLTGAGISAESGLKTFRDAGGLWEGHDVMQVASINGWHKNPKLVLEFYNERYSQLNEVTPNEAHLALVTLQQENEVVVITQNVDNLHERAGASKVIHLHGELTKMRGEGTTEPLYPFQHPLKIGDKDQRGNQLRPHIVWFGEAVPMLEKAIVEIMDAHIVMVIGTSLQVYPAAGLIAYAPAEATVIYIDPYPTMSQEMNKIKNLKLFVGKATQKTKEAIEYLREASLL